MKKINEKWSLFLIATFTVFFGITNNLLKGTEAKEENYLVDNVVLDLDGNGLRNIILGDIDIEFNPDIYSYKIKVKELDNLSVIPILTNDNIMYTVDIIGDIKTDKRVIIIVSVNIGLDNEEKYMLFIEEI